MHPHCRQSVASLGYGFLKVFSPLVLAFGGKNWSHLGCLVAHICQMHWAGHMFLAMVCFPFFASCAGSMDGNLPTLAT